MPRVWLISLGCWDLSADYRYVIEKACYVFDITNHAFLPLNQTLSFNFTGSSGNKKKTNWCFPKENDMT